MMSMRRAIDGLSPDEIRNLSKVKSALLFFLWDL